MVAADQSVITFVMVVRCSAPLQFVRLPVISVDSFSSNLFYAVLRASPRL